MIALIILIAVAVALFGAVLLANARGNLDETQNEKDRFKGKGL